MNRVDVDHLTRSLTNGLVNGAIQRASEVRVHEDRLHELLLRGDTIIVPVWQDRNLVNHQEPVSAVWLNTEDLAPSSGDTVVFLGMVDEKACFAVDLGPGDPRLSGLEQHGRFEELRGVGPLMDDAEASVLSYARGMCFWNRRHRFCGACGAPTLPGRGGHIRRCTRDECGIHHFPRTDPAIIVLVHTTAECLLGRKPEWPEGRYSTIAGFVEPGEAAEQAVVREVYEETGVVVNEVSYHSSQPWPFPGSVMLGFHARSTGRSEIELLDGELADARWFTREEVGRAMNKTGPLRLPPGISIARRLIEDWYHERQAG